jgi:hypothetical protein
MREASLTARKPARAFIAGAVACLFLLQTLAFVFTSNGRIAFASGDAGASIAMAGEICQAKTDADGKTPAPHSHHHRCTLCSLGHRDQATDVVALLASVIAVLAPRPDNTPAWFVHDEFTPFPPGWTSSWSSRAPPSFS